MEAAWMVVVRLSQRACQENMQGGWKGKTRMIRRERWKGEESK